MSPLQRSDFDALLGLQQVDTALDRLRSRLAALETGRDAELVAAEAAAADQLEALRSRLDEARRAQIRLEGAVSDLEERIRRADGRISQLSDAAQIEAAQRELSAARIHASDSEDELLEAMERVEELEREVGAAEDTLAVASRRREEAEGDLAEERRQVERAITEAETERTQAVEPVPAELVSAYESRRSAGQKVAAARFEAGRCGSCHLTLPATEADRIRTAPDHVVVTCDDCGTILVRPPRRAAVEADEAG